MCVFYNALCEVLIHQKIVVKIGDYFDARKKTEYFIQLVNRL